MTTPRHIIVGIDDSPNARAALRWALDNTGPDDEVTAINVWHTPATGGFEMGMLDPSVFEEGARETLRVVVSDVATGDEGDRVRQLVVGGHAPSVLIAESADADLLVLGARGHGGFAGLLLGSVTTSVAHHASCPVVIVPQPAD
jgi:nucleotide-binding universal stress UspA family protein